MDFLNALPAIPFVGIVAGLAAGLMLLAIGLLNWNVPSTASDPQSPTNLCLKCLDEGHDPLSAIEFVADWGPTAIKREFQGYVNKLKQGRPLEEVLDALRVARPTIETEMLVACLTSKAQTNIFSAVSSEIVRHATRQREQAQSDMDFIIGSSRRWVIGLTWVGILGGAMLLIALPVYSQALLNTQIGRLILLGAMAIETLGVIVAGRVLSLPHRLEQNLHEP